MIKGRSDKRIWGEETIRLLGAGFLRSDKDDKGPDS